MSFSCTTCQAVWTDGDFSEDCAECGGGAMTHDCFLCLGACGGKWKRAPMDSQDSQMAHWGGKCEFPVEQHAELRKQRLREELWSQGKTLPGEEPPPTDLTIVSGDLLEQEVDVIVNPWNRNIIPWWLLLPQGVAGGIRKRAGTEPFRQLARGGSLPLGGARLTGAGRLAFRGIIHVASIDMLWRSSEGTVEACLRSAIDIVNQERIGSVAFPLLGAGVGGRSEEQSLSHIEEILRVLPTPAKVVIVRYSP